MKKITTIILIMLFSPLILFGAEQISGHACYKFSDEESINAARDIALSLAKREALEGYSVFVQSTTTVRNNILLNDIIQSITVGLLNNLEVTEVKEDLNEREICRAIKADVEPMDIKKDINTRIAGINEKGSKVSLGLFENQLVKLINLEQLKKSFRGGMGSVHYAKMRFLCKAKGTQMYRIFHLDDYGIIVDDASFSVTCEGKGYDAYGFYCLTGTKGKNEFSSHSWYRSDRDIGFTNMNQRGTSSSYCSRKDRVIDATTFRIVWLQPDIKN